MSTHAELSPSGSKQWMTCAGSIGLIKKLIKKKLIPVSTTSIYAAEGTVAHEIHEHCLLNAKDAKEYLGQTTKANGFEFTVNDNMVEAVQQSLDYIYNRIEDAEFDGLTVEVLVEQRSCLKYLGIKGLDGGTADVILIFRNSDTIVFIEIIDYKHGQGVAVEVKENTQAMSYGLGIIQRPKFKKHKIRDGIKLTISQPRAHHPDGRIRSWDISKKNLLAWEKNELVPKAKATKKKNAPFVPTDDACRFCDASGNCEAQDKKTQEIAISEFKDNKFLDPDIMTPEQKRNIMDHAVMIRAFIVAVENQIKIEVDNGSKEYEDYYKLVQKTTKRIFVGDAVDEDFSPLLDYLDFEEVFNTEPKMKGLGDIEKALKKAVGTKKAAMIMASVTLKPEGSLVIAPISDKREGVQPTLISDFENLDDF